MSFDPTTLFLSLVVSGVGFVLFVYGRKQLRWPHLVAGLVLMVFPYFVDGFVAMTGIAGAVIALLWLGVHAGW
jgi:hypothetical protein